MKKLKYGHPPYLDEFEEMFHGNTVDGTSVYIPGQDFYEIEENDEDNGGHDADDVGGTHMSTSTHSLKRPSCSTTNTCTSPIKKSKSPMVRIMKQIATKFSLSMDVNQQALVI